ncbi:antitermination protein [Sodalis sp.]|uniref:transcriptional antitermination N peptide n=1 Tax=Sodalis sp. (in: enterobacteria) TaxID=1898979 RepID=UPI0038733C1C
MQRRTAYKGSSAARRRERRAHLQPIAVNDFGTALTINRPTPSKVELASKKKVSRINKAVSPITLTDLFKYQEQITLSAQKHMKARYPHRGTFVEFEEGSCCLENVALFQAGYRNSVNLTAR